MNLSYFIAKRISREQRKGFASTIHTIAIVSIAAGLFFLILSFLILNGFQETVKHKIYGFSGHLIMKKYEEGNAIEDAPIDYNIEFYRNYRQYSHVVHVQEYAYKPGLIKTEEEVLGVVMKGVGKSFNEKIFAENMVSGEPLHLPDSGYSNEVLLSKIIATKLKLEVGNDFVIHFFQDPPRSRKLKVAGIYETNMSEYFDSKVIIGDIRLIQRLNNWADSIAGGIEIFVSDNNRIEEAALEIEQAIDYDLHVRLVSDKYIQVFEWLHLLSRQVNILLVIILIVVSINMISIVLILVMERTQMIGILKALGARNNLIQRIFMYSGISLIFKGLFWGNILGLGVCYIQYRFGIIKLNAVDYYMSVVPISWDWEVVATLNILTFTIIAIVLFLPTMVITQINPIKAIRFD